MIPYEFHPLSKSLPLMHGPEFDELVEDIRKNGQLVPIGIFEGKILDGRNRFLACKRLKLQGKFERVTPRNARAYVTSMNVYRRQLTREQKQHHLMLLIASQDDLGLTNTEIAQAVAVSQDTVKRAKRKKGGKTPLFAPIVNEKRKNGENEETEHTESVEEVVDTNGVSIPLAARPYWDRKTEAKQVLAQISAARGKVKKLMPDDPMWSGVNLNGVIADLNSAYNRFAASVPAHVCPLCKGEKPDACKCCKGKGVLSEYFYRMVPEELKK